MTQPETTEQSQSRPADPAPLCACGHTKRDHSGRSDHREQGYRARPWCHACEAKCLYCPPDADDAAGTAQPQPEPEPFTYTDTDQDTLKIWATRILRFPKGSVSMVVTEGGRSSAVYVAPDRVDEVVAAIYTAAGRKPPRLDPIQECDTCHAGYTLGQPCATCAFNARMAAEQAARSL